MAFVIDGLELVLQVPIALVRILVLALQSVPSRRVGVAEMLVLGVVLDVVIPKLLVLLLVFDFLLSPVLVPRCEHLGTVEVEAHLVVPAPGGVQPKARHDLVSVARRVLPVEVSKWMIAQRLARRLSALRRCCLRLPTLVLSAQPVVPRAAVRCHVPLRKDLPVWALNVVPIEVLGHGSAPDLAVCLVVVRVCRDQIAVPSAVNAALEVLPSATLEGEPRHGAVRPTMRMLSVEVH
mmetsp:Transcript_27083/g.55137  ORF Transcript_27083/g.55137 Transcript_27083/m.55137 type:complete len:236 (-) Transcript_27083:322-1029(-)